jgi:hypothetical protein
MIDIITTTTPEITSTTTEYEHSKRNYTITDSDSCLKICLIHKLELNDLFNYNPFLDCSILIKGQTITIESIHKSNKKSFENDLIYYTSEGDSCVWIARKIGITFNLIFENNPNINCSNLQTNQSILILKDPNSIGIL